MSETWQPIETAPKDGTLIWAFVRQRGTDGTWQGVIYWDDVFPSLSEPGWAGMPQHSEYTNDPKWYGRPDYNEKVREVEPTHWMPLPPPPLSQDKETGNE